MLDAMLLQTIHDVGSFFLPPVDEKIPKDYLALAELKDADYFQLQTKILRKGIDNRMYTEGGARVYCALHGVQPGQVHCGVIHRVQFDPGYYYYYGAMPIVKRTIGNRMVRCYPIFGEDSYPYFDWLAERGVSFFTKIPNELDHFNEQDYDENREVQRRIEGKYYRNETFEAQLKEIIGQDPKFEMSGFDVVKFHEEYECEFCDDYELSDVVVKPYLDQAMIDFRKAVSLDNEADEFRLPERVDPYMTLEDYDRGQDMRVDFNYTNTNTTGTFTNEWRTV